MKHTPGPWVVESTETTQFILNENEVVVATCETQQELNQDDKANARLIAAAPELLEALREALSCIDQHTDDEVVGPIIELARTAITKATSD